MPGVELVFKIAGVGIIVSVIHTVLKQAGKEEQAYIATLAGVAVVLDRVQDAGNVGALLRTAAAAGAGTVYCLRGCAGAWTPKVLRAGMGAHFALALVEDARWEDIEAGLPRPLYATAGQGTRELYQLDLRGDVSWVFGNEGAGVDPAVLARCDAGVRIPQRGAVESLNVAAAAAVCLYEGLRQRMAAGG